MSYVVEKKGDGITARFLVFNSETGRQTGYFKKEDEAKKHANDLNVRDDAIRPTAEMFIDHDPEAPIEED